MSEEEDASIRQLAPVLPGIVRQALAQRTAQVSKMVRIIEARPIPTVITGKGRDAHQLSDAIDIQRHHKNGVGKIMALRMKAAMTQCSGIDRGFHYLAAATNGWTGCKVRSWSQFTPRAVATRMADFRPSS